LEISEKSFEKSIEDALILPKSGAGLVAEVTSLYGDFTPGGYRKSTPEEYDRRLCLIPSDVYDFILATQPKEWEKLKKQFEKDAKDVFLKKLADETVKWGTLHVVRKGIKAWGCKFQLAFFRPPSKLNPELQNLYEANIFTVVRQLKYNEKTEQSLDMVLFLNGLPIITAELKNPLTSQNVQNAIRQYRFDRDPKEPLFTFGRCLAHFAVDPELIYMTTHLQGPKTRFLPFNLGKNGGAGNPVSWKGYSTAYLWEHIWSRDSVLNLLQHFISEIEEEDDSGRKTGVKKLIFPRYHQLDAVRRLIVNARALGTGQNYLVQHSAGSGKSNSIAWLAHQLSVLHDAEDTRVFDSIIVITDRRVLDRQLQRTVQQFEQTAGVVENIDKTSRQLKEALELGKTIIVTTLQKFPVIVDQIGELSGKRFAVIVDEAHSSQTGESTKSLKAVLSVTGLEEAAVDEEGAEVDFEDLLVEEMRKRGRQPNVSFFAFTATPKGKTLELFGTKRDDGKYEPFSIYSMRQAIEEGFILDVLENYTTYKMHWNLLKKIVDDPRYDKKKAMALLKAFVDLHEHSIEKKLQIIVEHFHDKVAHRINGKAKAMIVTRSRLHAVRYRLAIDKYLKAQGYTYKALVAFTGTVRDGGMDYTEAGMNGLPESQTAKQFEHDENRFLIVAFKFQTGFDQPLLHTMYVDKKLGGVNAVQTLSRLNRIHPGKEETFVLDFSNQIDEIQKAFEPYYEKTMLKEGTDPNLLYDIQNKLEKFHLYSIDEVNRFVKFIFTEPNATQDKLYAALAPVIDRFKALEREEQQDDFRSMLKDYGRLYAFLSQIITFSDADLEKLYLFAKYLYRLLPKRNGTLPLEVEQNVDLDSLRLRRTHNGKIQLERGKGEVKTFAEKSGPHAPNEKEALSKIIQELNARFGTDFTTDDKVFIEHLETRLDDDAALQNSVKVNMPENARLTFDLVVNDRLQEMIDANFKFFKQINDNQEFSKFFLAWLFDRYRRRLPKEAR